MKIRKTVLGISLALGSLVAAAHAQERTVNAFNSFHVLYSQSHGTLTPYSCMFESYGAVVNKCTYKVTVGFDLPVDSSVGTIHTLNVQNYVNGKGTTGATCSLWSYDGNGNGALGTIATFNPNGAQTLTFTSAPSGNNMALLCTIPAGAGISAISWNP